ncbi:MAG TPA: hypothetical protein VK028_04205, partial [Micromonosporaceae bacterium]|nr:hypothetical protein [Micromonosporaceae bacterium]
VAVAVLLVAGCDGPPSLLCDRARVVWPFLDVDPSDDLDPGTEGIQVDVALRTTLIPGTAGYLSIVPEQGEAASHPQVGVVAEDGALEFQGVTLPVGRVTLALVVENECGQASTSRTIYVWDGLGVPQCELTTVPAATEVPELEPLAVLCAEQDGDPDAPGVQVEVAVATGRPDMTVTLFAVDPTGAGTRMDQEAGEDREARFPVDLADGEHALRAVCHWAPEDLHPSSITRWLWVDASAADCAVVEPGLD